MKLQQISQKQGKQIGEAAGIADHIFLYAERTAENMNVADFDGEKSEIARSICDKYPQLVAGFMQTIAIIYTAQYDKRIVGKA